MPYIGYAFILAVCLVVTLVVFGRISPKAFPFVLFGTGGGLVLMTSLAGTSLVGSDIHLEYFYALLRAGKDVLEPIWGTPQGSSLVTYFTDNIWAFKVVYPLIFATLPIILYYIFRKWFTPMQAFLASFFFIIFPAFSMELPGIVRQMVAEVVLALMFYLLFINNWRKKWILIGLLGILLPLLHYAVAAVGLIFLFLSFLLRKDLRKVVLLGGICILIASAIYFPIAEQGAVAKKLVYLYNGFVPPFMEIPAPPIDIPHFPKPEYVESPPEDVIPGSLWSRYEGLMLSGLGFDFLETTPLGKVFRILQWILLGLMALGLWKLRKNKLYWSFAAGGLVIVGLQILPGFSNLLNITRFLHLALIGLAPLIVVTLKPKHLLLLLIPYFLLTSGFIFEITKQPNIEEITIPYSVGLSNHRMNLGASLTEDDADVRQYILDNKLFPIYSDIHSSDFMGEVVGWRDDLHANLTRYPIVVHEIYVFVSSRNIQDGTFTAWNGIGRRRYVDPRTHYGIDWNENIVYQKGDSRVIWVP